MALTEAHKWVARRIGDSFAGLGLQREEVQAFIRAEHIKHKFDAFFRAEGPARIIVLYQPLPDESEVSLRFCVLCACVLKWSCGEFE
jgi:hypothetical protein